MLSASRIAAPTRVQSHGRLHEKPEIATATTSQTIPKEPISDSPSKIGSNRPSRWSTTQPWTLRSTPPKENRLGGIGEVSAEPPRPRCSPRCGVLSRADSSQLSALPASLPRNEHHDLCDERHSAEPS